MSVGGRDRQADEGWVFDADMFEYYVCTYLLVVVVVVGWSLFYYLNLY